MYRSPRLATITCSFPVYGEISAAQLQGRDTASSYNSLNGKINNQAAVWSRTWIDYPKPTGRWFVSISTVKSVTGIARPDQISSPSRERYKCIAGDIGPDYRGYALTELYSYIIVRLYVSVWLIGTIYIGYILLINK